VNHKTANLVLTFTVFLVMTVVIALVGATVVWSDETRLTTNPSWDAFPSIAQLQGDKIWVAWQSDRVNNWTFDIYHTIWDRWLGTWSVPFPLTVDPTHDVTPSLMQTNDGTLWLFWASMRTGNYDLFYKTSSDNGNTWTNATQLTTNPERDIAPSVIQVADGTIWVVWQTINMGNYDLFYKTSSDNGNTWTNATQLTTNVYNDESPSIVQMQDGTIWVVWQYTTEEPDFEIFYKTYNGSWSSDTPLTENPDFDWNPSVVQSRDGMIWVFWSRELRVGGPGHFQDDLFYKTSVDNGATWSEDIRLTTDEDWNEDAPSAVHAKMAGDTKLWLIWHSDKDDNFDVYYIKTHHITCHDVAITDVTPNSTMVYRNETVSINVTVENQGEMSGPEVEIFTVDCYANTNLIGSEVVFLRGGKSKVIVFSWNTSNFAFDTYTISANASGITQELPINLDDNIFTDGTVLVTIAGDFDLDIDVDWFDFAIFAAAYGSSEGDSNFLPEADFDLDGDIDWFDFSVFASNYGKSG
jgi:hypothetical protein